jgi:hypothetical protein
MQWRLETLCSDHESVLQARMVNEILFRTGIIALGLFSAVLALLIMFFD